MWAALQILREREVLSDVDVELARLLAELEPQADWAVILGACLASRAPQRGETCLDLAARAGAPIPEEGEPNAETPGLEAWRGALAGSGLVGDPGDFRPLILEGDRLYLQRYWAYEARIAEDLIRRAGEPADDVDETALRASLGRLFPEPSDEGPDWQRVAAAVAVLRRLTVITGGPGTGKTTTVTRLLAALLEQPHGQELRIALAAPTGKAAARMQEAVLHARAELGLEESLKERIPAEARTLHRLLGARSDSIGFRHDRNNPLPFDVVVVDEASMVDVALFARLLDAVPEQARLIIVGDRDQLAPVEAGAVLPEITTGEPGFSADFASRVTEIAGTEVPSGEESGILGDSRVELQRAHRFDDTGGLGPLIRAVQAGDAENALAVLQDPGHPDVGLRDLPEDREGREKLVGELAEGFEALLRAGESGHPEPAFAAYRSFGVLDAMRQGPLGSEALNRRIEAALRRRGRIRSTGAWYPGRPVLVTRNDYRLGLFNGDVGIAVSEGGRLRIHFETTDGGMRALTPNRLPPFETAFVLTVHKSQGSEFDRVELLVPESATGLNSQELLYTGISRAREGLTLGAPEAILRQAITNPLRRASGLNSKILAIRRQTDGSG